MRYSDLSEAIKHYYHGSGKYLPVGTILTPRSNYEEHWSGPEYAILEKYRPSQFLAHADSVFMADNPDDIDALGGETDWLFTVKPNSRIEQHDQSWVSEILIVLDQEPDNTDKIKEMASKYWNGVSSGNPVWEYLTPSATIVAVEEY